MSNRSVPEHHHVSPDQTIPFPLRKMTDQQREVISEFLRARRNSQLSLQEPISFVRLLVRHKPGVTLSTLSMPNITDYEPTITIEDVITQFDLEYRCVGTKFIVARTAWRLDLLPELDDWSDALTRRMGVFLGYPTVDIEHFINSDSPNIMLREYIEERIFDPTDLAFTRFIPQRHDDSIVGLERAITRGKEIWALLSRYAIQWNLPELTEYVEWLYQQALQGLCGDEYLYRLHWPT